MRRTTFTYLAVIFGLAFFVFVPAGAEARSAGREAPPPDRLACSGWPRWLEARLWPGWFTPCVQPAAVPATAAAGSASAEASFPPASTAEGLASPAAGIARHHVLGPGETIWGISLHYGLSLDALLAANGLKVNSIVSQGTDLLIPYTNEPGAAHYGQNGRPQVNGRGLHLVASIAQQKCWLFRDTQIVEQWICSTGRPSSPSIPGNYTVESKMDRAFNVPADSWMPYWLGIYSVGDTENGIHGMPYAANDPNDKAWIDKVGVPITFGCVMLDDGPAIRLYNLAYIGMPVTILP